MRTFLSLAFSAFLTLFGTSVALAQNIDAGATADTPAQSELYRAREACVNVLGADHERCVRARLSLTMPIPADTDANITMQAPADWWTANCATYLGTDHVYCTKAMADWTADENRGFMEWLLQSFMQHEMGNSGIIPGPLELPDTGSVEGEPWQANGYWYRLDEHGTLWLSIDGNIWVVAPDQDIQQARPSFPDDATDENTANDTDEGLTPRAQEARDVWNICGELSGRGRARCVRDHMRMANGVEGSFEDYYYGPYDVPNENDEDDEEEDLNTESSAAERAQQRANIRRQNEQNY